MHGAVAEPTGASCAARERYQVSPIEIALLALKTLAELARALGATDDDVHGAVTAAEAAAVDLEVDVLEEAKLHALAKGRVGGPGIPGT